MWQNPGDCRRSYSLNSPKKSQTLLDTHLRQIGVGLALLGMLVGKGFVEATHQSMIRGQTRLVQAFKPR